MRLMILTYIQRGTWFLMEEGTFGAAIKGPSTELDHKLLGLLCA